MRTRSRAKTVLSKSLLLNRQFRERRIDEPGSGYITTSSQYGGIRYFAQLPSTITDNPTGGKVYKEVDHALVVCSDGSKRGYDLVPKPDYVYYVSGKRVYLKAFYESYSTTAEDLHTSGMYNTLQDLLANATVDSEAARAAAFRGLTPSPEPDLSMINFLIELKDMKWALDGVKRNMDAWKRKTAKEVTTDSYLGWNFGLAPFIGDLANITKAFGDLAKKLRTAPYRRPYTRKTSGRGVATSPVVSTRLSVNGWTHECEAQRKVTYVVSARVKNRYDPGNRMEMAVRQIAQALGLRLDAAILWNAIPFSFVVDWCTTTGDLFDQLHIDTYTPEVVTDILGYSLCEETTYNYYATPNRSGAQRQTLGVVTERRYRRSLDCSIPEFWSSTPSLTLKMLSGKQITLALALATAFTKK